MNSARVKTFYYLMKLGREFELAAKQEYMKGNIAGFLHLDIGQEACSVGSMQAFDKGDVFTHYREHVLAIARGMDPKVVMAELFGKATGVSKGKGGSMHLFDPTLSFYGGDAIVAGHLPIATGCAYARKVQGEKAGVFAIFGDGATNAGAFFESINIAAAWKLPLIFFCENNYYAIGTRIGWVSPFEELFNKAKNYMPAKRIDGMDVCEVYKAVTEAKEYLENGLGPYFIEAETYRYEGHSMSDNGKYRSEEEMEIFKSRDPIEKLKREAIALGIVEESYFDETDKKIEQEINEAIEFAANSPEPELNELYEDVYCKECTNVVS
ncbi:MULTISPECIES: thiamine pyrophosphate-dependent dehydrogenase E1 component subunit alpha [unclassified Nitratiruptor]|uniref:thiamine pyrophosphate-dependent dehydrogenase E1 component subunit alpha n=1 Tax=unclassified Nitratiruptor TaxID=2624044 RepID=UPI0019162B6E|nr:MULTISPECIES: thiamine pyrophosphate-dependent enzyme [unclassified Nitratiruptor]BCD60349.1 pyruvate dehydrogenase E1 component alpha subunit [Nitratiruptor sp. YY08-10]BCD64162.1 pyruvate dehydrogenase E1 component alpha subunit [Nitratiruptor sp. YY08-14]